MLLRCAKVLSISRMFWGYDKIRFVADDEVQAMLGYRTLFRWRVLGKMRYIYTHLITPWAWLLLR